jgi:ligand-binding SRPBCC domain-containing protein
VRSRRSTSSGSGGRSASGPELSAHRDEGDPGRAREERGVRCIERAQVVPLALDDAFAFFADAANLEAITPPWLQFRILTPLPGRMREGTQIEFRLRWRGVPLRWRTRIQEWRELCHAGVRFVNALRPAGGSEADANTRFVDEQIRGPYRLWRHVHTFSPVPGGTQVRDEVIYALPFGLLGALAHAAIVRRDLDAIFDYRAQKVAALLGASVSGTPIAVPNPNGEASQAM